VVLSEAALPTPVWTDPDITKSARQRAVAAPFATLALGESVAAAAHGAVARVSPREVESAIPTFQRVSAALQREQPLSELVGARILASTSHPVRMPGPRHEPVDSGAILEVQLLNLALCRTSHFSRKFELRATGHAKATCAQSGERLATFTMRHAGGRRRALRIERWAADDGSLLKEELERALGNMADQVVQAWFPSGLNRNSSADRLTASWIQP
jgi:hypothetical protein